MINLLYLLCLRAGRACARCRPRGFPCSAFTSGSCRPRRLSRVGRMAAIARSAGGMHSVAY
eukprot:5083594-Alexandrium_andersonii.AAC.1